MQFLNKFADKLYFGADSLARKPLRNIGEAKASHYEFLGMRAQNLVATNSRARVACPFAKDFPKNRFTYLALALYFL